jgi:hypothetical protein
LLILRYLLINKLKHLDIQGVRSVGMLKREMEDLAQKGNTICIGISAIPTPPAEFPSEEMVYDIADEVLRSAYSAEGQNGSEDIQLPAKRIFLDMSNEVGLSDSPNRISLRSACRQANAGVLREHASEAGWTVLHL